MVGKNGLFVKCVFTFLPSFKTHTLYMSAEQFVEIVNIICARYLNIHDQNLISNEHLNVKEFLVQKYIEVILFKNKLLFLGAKSDYFEARDSSSKSFTPDWSSTHSFDGTQRIHCSSHTRSRDKNAWPGKFCSNTWPSHVAYNNDRNYPFNGFVNFSIA